MKILFRLHYFLLLELAVLLLVEEDLLALVASGTAFTGT